MTGIVGRIGCVGRYKYPVENSKSDRRERLLPWFDTSQPFMLPKYWRSSIRRWQNFNHSTFRWALCFSNSVSADSSCAVADNSCSSKLICIVINQNKEHNRIELSLLAVNATAGSTCPLPFLFFLSHAPASIASLMSAPIFTLKARFLRQLGDLSWRWYCIDCA